MSSHFASICFPSIKFIFSERWALLTAGVSRGKGQDLFLHSFHESLQLVREKKLQLPSIHAVIVGSDLNAQTKFETELRHFVQEKGIEDRVHFVNKTLTVAPYLASIDVLVQNSQVALFCCPVEKKNAGFLIKRYFSSYAYIDFSYKDVFIYIYTYLHESMCLYNFMCLWFWSINKKLF